MVHCQPCYSQVSCATSEWRIVYKILDLQFYNGLFCCLNVLLQMQVWNITPGRDRLIHVQISSRQSKLCLVYINQVVCSIISQSFCIYCAHAQQIYYYRLFYHSCVFTCNLLTFLSIQSHFTGQNANLKMCNEDKISLEF